MSTGARGIAALALAQLALAGCVTGGDAADGQTHSVDRTCDSLNGDHRRLARQLDAAEHSNAAPNSAGGLILLVGLLGGQPAGASSGVWGNMARKDKERAVASMHAQQTELDQEIDAKRCTLEARAKAQLVKSTDDAQYDGVYAGKGMADSWCTQPSLSVTVKSGRLTGSLRESAKLAAEYEVEGQVYEGGEVSLHFKQPAGTAFTDDFDGRFTDHVLSFTARLDPSPKACTYRFAVKR